MKRLLERLFPPFAFVAASLGALAIGTRPRKKAPPGNLKMTVTPITFPTKYLQADKLTPADVGLERVAYGFAVLTDPNGEGSTVNVANVIYDPDAETLKLFDETPAEVANEAEVKKVTCTVYAWGS
jgi:hypothetical protein